MTVSYAWHPGPGAVSPGKSYPMLLGTMTVSYIVSICCILLEIGEVGDPEALFREEIFLFFMIKA